MLIVPVEIKETEATILLLNMATESNSLSIFLCKDLYCQYKLTASVQHSLTQVVRTLRVQTE